MRRRFGIIKPHVLSRGILLLWSLWLSVVFSSNFCDALQQAGILPGSWRFVSGNFALVLQTIEIYGLPRGLAVLLFAGVLVAQLAAAILFWRAFIDREATSTSYHPKVMGAFSVAIGLFGAFLVGDELFIVYARLPGLVTTHLLVLAALLLSLLTVSVLVDRTRAA